MTVNPQRVRQALDGLLANADQIGAADPERSVEELLGMVVGNPDADPVDAVGTLVRVLRQSAAALDELARQAEEQGAARPPAGMRVGIGFTHNPDGSPRRFGSTGLGDYYQRRIIR